MMPGGNDQLQIEAVPTQTKHIQKKQYPVGLK
jgi:hypothetical protein